ncbi:MAG: hypothetical protein WCX95_00510 [Candidatus Gracilibacteria bacterium]
MPDQNGGGNQNGNQQGGPVNPFQPKVIKPENQARAENQAKPENHVKPESHPKAINPFAANPVKVENSPMKVENASKHDNLPKQGNQQPKPVNPFAASLPRVENSHKPMSPSVKPVNPFSSVSKVDQAIEGEIITKKIEPKEVPKEKVTSIETPKVTEIPKVKEAEMPKSAEIPEAPKAKQEGVVKVVESKPEVKQESPKNESVNEFKNQMMDVLSQAGITKGTLIKTIVVIGIAVIMVMAYVYGWYGMIANKFESGVGQTTQQQTSQEMTTPIETNKPEIVNPSSAYGLVSAYIFGLEFSAANTPIEAVPIGTWGSDAGIRAASVFGMVLDEKKVKFIEYVALLRQLQNIYDTDVYALLDMSVDRRAALQQHMNELVVLLDKAGVAYSDLDAQLALFDQQYAPIILNKDTYEASFFNSLYAYYGDQAYVNLGMFVKSSQDMVTMKAYFNAYKALRDLLGAYINSLRTRYSDISANTEALIKGVRVFYVPNSDIKTIIKLGE